MIENNCPYCVDNLPLSPGNKNFHKTESGGYVQCLSPLSVSTIQLQSMENITIQDLDKIVLSERTSLENASLEEIEKRVLELQDSYNILVANQKLLKAKQVVALEKLESITSRLPKEEIQKIKKVKKIDSNLDALMEQVLKMKSSQILNEEEKK